MTLSITYNSHIHVYPPLQSIKFSRIIPALVVQSIQQTQNTQPMVMVLATRSILAKSPQASNNALMRVPFLSASSPLANHTFQDIYAEATFVCPSYWLNQAFTAPSRIGYKYQYSVPFASHTDDIPAYFGPATPNQSSDFTLAFRRIWGNFITKNNPSISNQIANGASSANPSAANVASNWPAYTDTNPKMINLNETGGTPYTAITNFGVPVTQFQGPSLRNDIKLVDANKWEANRGARCAFWRSIARQIPV